MSKEDKETSPERVEPLDVKPIKGVKGTTRFTSISAEKKKDQE